MFHRIIELGLFRQRKTSNEDPTIYFGRLFDRLFALLVETSVESKSLDTTGFRKKLEQYRAVLADAGHREYIAAAAEDGLDLCQDYLKRARTEFLRREGEYASVIDMLRQALSDLAGDSSELNSKLTASSERLRDLSKVDDLRILKRNISEEIRFLKQAVAEKQKKDDEGYKKLSEKIESLQGSLSQSQPETSLDTLTRIPNRGTFDRTLRQWVQPNGSPRSFVLALLDVDNFKDINDDHGHQIGDQMLQCAAMWLSNGLRTADFVARFGGDEFAVLLSGRLPEAQAKFNTLLQRIAASAFNYKKNDVQTSEVRFTLSCGLALFCAGDKAEDLLTRADAALSEAKRLGKNRVAVERRGTEQAAV